MGNLLHIFKALADPTRLRILKMLMIKPLCVCEVMHVLNMAQSTTSRHLQILFKTSLIEVQSGGTWTVYRIPKKPEPVIVNILNLVSQVADTEESKTDAVRTKKADRNRICEQKMKNRKRGDEWQRTLKQND